ncbi:MAG TPA: hypothetical protein P5552_18535, partial [Candidatus Competibacteraceae bacterium]|nr:hypothetical protein [Candidatus Competibacteraceae bacterium]
MGNRIIPDRRIRRGAGFVGAFTGCGSSALPVRALVGESVGDGVVHQFSVVFHGSGLGRDYWPSYREQARS